MGLIDQSREVLRVLREMRHVLPLARLKFPEDSEAGSLGTMFEAAVARYPDNTLLIFEGRQWTYAEFNADVNRLAHLLADRGVQRGDCVALFMENRAEFFQGLLAVTKLGATASLINSSLKGHALVHCLRSTEATTCLFGEERTEPLAEVLPQLSLERGRDYLWLADAGAAPAPEWAVDAGAMLPDYPAGNLAVTRDITAGETALYIFTSGTTGLPKAAIMAHRKLLVAGSSFGPAGFRLQPTDRLYLCLPIYHITGLGPGFCAFMAGGGSIFLRRSFSASHFWPEVQHYRTNCFVYVGELCRYLVNREPVPEERDNPLTKVVGNGLRPDVWDEFKQRFGIERICEIYGSSEGNVNFVNLLNKDRTIGAALTPVAVVRYDADSDSIPRDEKGRCIEVADGEPGLLLGEITDKAKFDGYTNPEATQDKILRNVREEGDQWFNTGDLVRRVDVGFAMGMPHFQFVDRTGDTFRWRSENVSTNEVAEVLNRHPQIHMANVYGVEIPGIEGRAGMVAFAFDAGESFDLDAFQALVEAELPPYAQPVFVRLLGSTPAGAAPTGAASTTETFKLRKAELREQAYHPDRVGDDVVYVRKPHGECYERLDSPFYERLMQGSAGF